MKILHIEARINQDIPLEKLGQIKEEKIGLVTTIQHVSQLASVKQELEKLGKKVYTAQGSITQYEGQILGCDVNAGWNVSEKVDAFLYIGTGDFHPLHLAFKVKKPIYLLSPEGELDLLSMQDIDRALNRKKAALAKFYSEDEIGILVSTKPGQEFLNFAIHLKEKLEQKGKKAFILMANKLEVPELENFPIKVWINTACPGLQLEESFLNPADIANFFRR